jgi:hypothetical protein
MLPVFLKNHKIPWVAEVGMEESPRGPMAYYMVKRVSGNRSIVEADSEEEARKLAAKEDEIVEVVYLSVLLDPEAG